MKTIGLLIVSLLTMTAYADTNIVGSYQCKGFDPFHSKTANYSNPVNITKNGDTYSFQWLHANGYPYIYGTGIMHKDIPNVITVVFWDPTQEDYIGIESYDIKSDGTLQGAWTLKSENKTGTETCTKK